MCFRSGLVSAYCCCALVLLLKLRPRCLSVCWLGLSVVSSSGQSWFGSVAVLNGSGSHLERLVDILEVKCLLRSSCEFFARCLEVRLWLFGEALVAIARGTGFYSVHYFGPLTLLTPTNPSVLRSVLQSFKIFEAAPTDVRGVPHKSPAPAEYFL